MPRLVNFSSVNATIDNLNVKCIRSDGYHLPYSLVVATTESLPEEGDSFTTTTFVPFQFEVKSITLQINQVVQARSKVKVTLCGKQYLFTVSSNEPTVNIQLEKSVIINQGGYEKVSIENMPNDDGDVSACSVLLNGLVK